jgi:hypothetical protein
VLLVCELDFFGELTCLTEINKKNIAFEAAHLDIFSIIRAFSNWLVVEETFWVIPKNENV